jgi:hypothetical protein
MRCHSVLVGIVLSAFVISWNSQAQAASSLAVRVAIPAVDTPIGFVIIASLSVPDSAADLSCPRLFPATADTNLSLI